MTTQTEALNIAIDYMNERLEEHDAKYQRHPATEAERNNILADIETVKESLAQQEAYSNYCFQCESLSRELAALKAQQSNEQSKCNHTKTITRADSDGNPIETTCGECGERVAQQSNEQEINPKTTFDEVERGLQQSRMVIATLDSITTEQRQQINEPLLKAQLFLKVISKAVTETAIQQSNEQVEPVAHKKSRIHWLCQEWKEDHLSDINFVEAIIDECLAHPPVPTAQPKEPEQEPVAWMDARQPWDLYKNKPQFDAVPLYTTQPQHSANARKPLTDEEIERLIFRSGGHKSTQNLMSNPMQVREYVELWNERIYKFARAIEAAHGIKEKNT